MSQQINKAKGVDKSIESTRQSISVSTKSTQKPIDNSSSQQKSATSKKTPSPRNNARKGMPSVDNEGKKSYHKKPRKQRIVKSNQKAPKNLAGILAIHDEANKEITRPLEISTYLNISESLFKGFNETKDQMSEILTNLKSMSVGEQVCRKQLMQRHLTAIEAMELLDLEASRDIVKKAMDQLFQQNIVQPPNEIAVWEVERPIKTVHPLENKWAFWFLKSDRSKSWEDCLKKIVVIETVEDFWGVYLQIVPPSFLPNQCDYYFFKEGIEPKWEHPRNIDGGRLVASIDRRKKNDDEMWLALMMLLASESFGSQSESICGAVFNARTKGNKIALWTSEPGMGEGNCQIAQTFSSRLDIKPEYLRYDLHKASSNRSKLPTENSFKDHLVPFELQAEPQLTPA